jgi:KipI family sensor histidine kinase inhibitor
MKFKPKIVSMGDSAVLVQFGDEIDIAINQHVHALATLINLSPLSGLIETVPAYGTLLVHYDPLLLSFGQTKNYLGEKLTQVQDNVSRKHRQVDVPVRYGGEYGIDLETVAHRCRLQTKDVVRIHAEKIYTVFMMGFTPGFPYMGKLNDTIVMPRLEQPRTRVPAGTVAIAGSQTGIYPIDSPGGWQLIGWTSLQLFNPESESPFLFSPGDEVKFVAE